jgi:AcrR family transcriptional regulator
MAVIVTRRRAPVRPDSLNVLRGQRTRRRILDAARQRILDGGFEALRLDDLARDASITKAAVVKSVGGKALILLALGDEDRRTRFEAIRQAIGARTGLKRRLADITRRLLELDLARLNVVMAYIGYIWFWAEDEHDRAQAMLDESRSLLGELIEAASAERLPAERIRLLALRVMSAYAIALRDIHFRRATAAESVRFVVDYVLE